MKPLHHPLPETSCAARARKTAVRIAICLAAAMAAGRPTLAANLLQDEPNITAAAASPDSSSVVTSARSVKLWDVRTGKLRAALQKAAPGQVLLFSPDSRAVAVGSAKGPVWIWDAHTGKMRWLIPNTPGGSVIAFAFSQDSSLLATYDYSDRLRTSDCRVWNLKTGRVACAVSAHMAAPDPVTSSILISPDDRFLALAGGTVKLWNIRTRRAGPALKDASAPVAFSPDGRQLATGMGTTGASIWNLRTGRAIRLRAVAGPLETVAVSSRNGGILATVEAHLEDSNGERAEVRLWHFGTGQNIPLPDHELYKRVDGITFHGAALFAVSTNYNGNEVSHSTTATVWTGPRWVKAYTLEPVSSDLVFSHDGALLATMDVDADLAEEMYNHYPILFGPGRASSALHKDVGVPLTFTPDGTRLLTAGNRIHILKIQRHPLKLTEK